MFITQLIFNLESHYPLWENFYLVIQTVILIFFKSKLRVWEARGSLESLWLRGIIKKYYMWRVIGSLSSSPLSWTSCRCAVCPFPSFLSLMRLYRTYTRTLLECRSVFCLLCFLEGGQVGHSLPFLFHWTQSGAAFSHRKF